MQAKVFIQNGKIGKLLEDDYDLAKLKKIDNLLLDKGTFAFPALNNGLFPAAIVGGSTAYTGYAAVWVRDNVYVALSHYIFGEVGLAVKNAVTLMRYFTKHRQRLENIVSGLVDSDIEMERPHVRFNGDSLEEINQQWGHSQNDALGYFLWFYCKLLVDKALHPTQEDSEMLALFAFYFDAISYWQDEDSGHWEEERKIEASSIGVVTESLKSLKKVIKMAPFASAPIAYRGKSVTEGYLDGLVKKGSDSLSAILPYECVQAGKERACDAALLFLIYPMQSVNGETADKIVSNVVNNLQGEVGVSRYLGDSFWCRDYEDLPENIRTSVSSDREKWFREQGRFLAEREEAQWCIFDPIISIIYGQRFQETRQADFLKLQTHYLNRSLGQVTSDSFKLGGFKCPELYYLRGKTYVPNDATPLLWTQANLQMALWFMKKSLTIGG